jgi:hypothetical protein
MSTMARVSRKFTTDNRKDKYNIPNPRVQGDKEKCKRRRSCEEMREEHSREIGNHIETGKRRIWPKASLQVYKEPPPPLRS